MPSAATPFPPQPPAPSPTAKIDSAARRRLFPPAARAEPSASPFRAELTRAARGQGTRSDPQATEVDAPRATRVKEYPSAMAKPRRSSKPNPRPAADGAQDERAPDEPAEATDKRARANGSGHEGGDAVERAEKGAPVEATATDESALEDETNGERTRAPVEPLILPLAVAVTAPPEPAGAVPVGTENAAAVDAIVTAGGTAAAGATSADLGAVVRPGLDQGLTSAAADAFGTDVGATASNTGAELGEPPASHASIPSRSAQPAGVAGLGSGPTDGLGTGDVSAFDTTPSAGGGRSGREVPPAAEPSPAIEFAEAFADSLLPDATSPSADPVGTMKDPGPLGNGVGLTDPSLLGRAAPEGNPQAADARPAGGARAPEELTEDRFAAVNHARIAREVRGELMPNGGSMHLRLDPPELGALQVSLHMRDGIVTAAFQPQNEDAARLLSHTMGDLRTSLEAHGIVVDKLHVQQATRDESARDNPGSGSRQNTTSEQQQDARREQQRKDMVQRLWDKLAGNAPLDLIA